MGKHNQKAHAAPSERRREGTVEVEVVWYDTSDSPQRGPSITPTTPATRQGSSHQSTSRQSFD
jgi:hypothetical protein